MSMKSSAASRSRVTQTTGSKVTLFKSPLPGPNLVTHRLQQTISYFVRVHGETSFADCLLDFFDPRRIENFAICQILFDALKLGTELNTIALRSRITWFRNPRCFLSRFGRRWQCLARRDSLYGVFYFHGFISYS